MAVNEMRDYLLPLGIPNEDKRYVLNFCKKLEYLDSLRKQASTETGLPIELGYGDSNSKICFIFKDKKSMKIIKKALQEHLDYFNLNLWDVWITFVDKVPIDYPNKYTFLSYEVNAINPSVIYMFDENQNISDSVEQAIHQVSCSNLRHYFFVDTNIFSKDDARKLLWPQFRFLINYKTLDIKE